MMKLFMCDFVTKSHSLFLGLAAALLLAGCSTTLPTPSDKSHALSQAYIASAKVATGVLQSDVLPAQVEQCVKAADNVAYDYVKQVNLKAQEWEKAGRPDKTVLEQAVDQLVTLAQSAMTNVAVLLSKKEC